MLAGLLGDMKWWEKNRVGFAIWQSRVLVRRGPSQLATRDVDVRGRAAAVHQVLLLELSLPLPAVFSSTSNSTSPPAPMLYRHSQEGAASGCSCMLRLPAGPAVTSRRWPSGTSKDRSPDSVTSRASNSAWW